MHSIPISRRLQDDLSHLPYLTGHLPGIIGTIKAAAEHFHVEELLPYTACGEGEHVYVTLRRGSMGSGSLSFRLSVK